MGRKSVSKERNLNPKKREKYGKLLMPIFQVNGLKKFTMDDLADELGVSKATLYHYFTSKEDIVGYVLKDILWRIKEFVPVLQNKELDYLDRYFQALKIMSTNVVDVSNIFLQDLQEDHPKLWSLVDQFKNYAIEILKDFYNEGKSAGVFNNFSTDILALGDSLFFDALSNPEILASHNLTIGEAFEAYFKMKCFGLFTNKEQSDIWKRVNKILDEPSL